MEWRNVNHSDSVVRIGYDVKTRELQVQFTSGGIYAYHAVPKAVADRFLNASSKGKFVAEVLIKDGYKYTCIERAPKKDPTHVSEIAKGLKKQFKEKERTAI